MTHYLLDTNILVYLEKPESPNHQRIIDRLSRLEDNDQLYLSVLSVFEMSFGEQLLRQRKKLELADRAKQFIDYITTIFTILPLTLEAGDRFGEIKASFKEFNQHHTKERSNIGKHDIDLMIASTALKHGLTVVSNDAIFERLQSLESRLKVESWL